MFGALGLVMVAAIVLVGGEASIVPAFLFAFTLWAGLTDHARSKRDDDRIGQRRGMRRS